MTSKNGDRPTGPSIENRARASFRNEDLSYVRFYESDLRGVDFSGSDLSGARFINVRTGIRLVNMILIFFGALLLSALSGYFGMLAGSVIQTMLASADEKIRIIGTATIGIIIFFIAYYYWKGGRNALSQFLVPLFFFSIIVGGVSYFSGAGTGKGMLYELLSLLLMILMFIAGTIARAVAGSLSNVLFLIVAITGSLFSKNIGGGIGSVIMALSCALISKRALSGASGFETLRKLAFLFTSKFGTSFRNCRFNNTDFSESKTVRNSDFSNADVSSVYWGDCKKMNCIL